MEKLRDLKDLLINELQTLYSSNKLEALELPNIKSQVNSPELKMIITNLENLAKDEMEMLESELRELKANCEGDECMLTKNILYHMKQIIDHSIIHEVRDAGIIKALQQLRHRKISGLGATVSYSKELSYYIKAKTLYQFKLEEQEMDEQLSYLAKYEINRKAVHALPL